MIWEADLYRRPLQSETGEPLWELLLCDRPFQFSYGETRPQSAVNASWVRQAVQTALDLSATPPEAILVFRPQALSLLQTACEPLGIPVKPDRHTPAIKRWLTQRAQWYPTLENYTGEPYDPLALDRPPPTPLPENLWGDQWRFASLSAADLEQRFQYEPIPIKSLPAEALPLKMGLPSTTAIPGVVIDGGRRSMALAQWLQQAIPVALNAIPGSPDGLILEAGLVDRWIVATFDDPEVSTAARTFEQRKQASRGLHFLLVRPDDSGITHTGLWLLRQH